MKVKLLKKIRKRFIIMNTGKGFVVLDKIQKTQAFPDDPTEVQSTLPSCIRYTIECTMGLMYLINTREDQARRRQDKLAKTRYLKLTNKIK
jgi:hypothetical protein